MLKFEYFVKFLTIHDNEVPGEDPPNEDPPADPPEDKQTYTKEELNEIITKERKRNEDKTKKTIVELEQLKKSKNLTDQEKSQLANRVEELQNSLLTKEELTKKEQEKLRTQHNEQVKSLTAERDTWASKYQDSVILRSITDAAAEEEAFNPRQIIALLKPETRLVDELDSEGKPTGNYIPKVKFNDEGVVLDMTVPEAVKRMKDLPEQYGNLFKANVNGGLGLSGGIGGTAPKDIKNMTPEEYRARGRKQLGIKG
jgi:hypothetical protein